MNENLVEFDLYGAVYTGKEEIDLDKLNDEFINFIESKGWSFCGGMRPIDYDEIHVGDKVVCIVNNSPTIAPCEVCKVEELIADSYLKLEGYGTTFNKNMFRKY